MTDPVATEPRDPGRRDQVRQIRFVVTPTGMRVAYATVGRGPALVVPAAWLSHLEVAWQDPAIRAFYTPIAAFWTVVTYDKPSCGLSDPWPVPDAPPAAPPERSPGPLTARQLQVAALVAEGLTNRQIAGRLGIEERSAEGHVERIRQRLGVRSRAQIASWWAAARGDEVPN